MELTNKSTLRVMIDSNILFSGIGWNKLPHEILIHAINDDFTLVLSDYILAEVYHHIATKLPHKIDTYEEIIQLLDFELIEVPSNKDIESNRELIRDIKDVPIALMAIRSNVDVFVTRDKDFLDRTPENKNLLQQLNILRPGTFLREYMQWTDEKFDEVLNR